MPENNPGDPGPIPAFLLRKEKEKGQKPVAEKKLAVPETTKTMPLTGRAALSFIKQADKPKETKVRTEVAKNADKLPIPPRRVGKSVAPASKGQLAKLMEQEGKAAKRGVTSPAPKKADAETAKLLKLAARTAKVNAENAKAKPMKAKATKPAKERKPSKSDVVETMLLSAKGATREELSKASGWPHVNLKVAAERAGKKLREEKDGRFRLV